MYSAIDLNLEIYLRSSEKLMIWWRSLSKFKCEKVALIDLITVQINSNKSEVPPVVHSLLIFHAEKTNWTASAADLSLFNWPKGLRSKQSCCFAVTNAKDSFVISIPSTPHFPPIWEYFSFPLCHLFCRRVTKLSAEVSWIVA